MPLRRFYERLLGKPADSCASVCDGTPVFTTPEWDALNAFDAVHSPGPYRTVAQRIAVSHGIDQMHSIVDDISHALEDAHEFGVKRGPYERRALESQR